ncbi:POK25 protein, partial [Todus mexicanus]|nr:POK25 protein [Todus mexicanus]
VQKLVGAINWVRPYLGLKSSQLSLLMDLLKGNSNISAPRKLTKEACLVVRQVEQAIQNKYVYRIDPNVEVQVFVSIDNAIPYAMILQWNIQWVNLLHIL